MREFEHLDVNVTTSCNLRCMACSHASPFSPRYFMAPETMAYDLRAIKPFLCFGTIYMVGGEPTLHSRLLEFLDVAKASGVGKRVGVITNGRLLPKMLDGFWTRIDTLRLSVYAGLDPAVIDLCKQKSEQHGFEFEQREYPEFYKQFKPQEDDGAESFKDCPWRTNCYTIHEGHFYLCPQSVFFPKLFMGKIQEIDGLPLAGLTEEDLTAFLDRTTPLTACRICCGGHGETTPWAEAKSKKEWMERSTI